MLKPRAWREQLEFTQERMGAYVGVGRTAWLKYERGYAVPPIDVIVRCQHLSGGRVTAESWLALSLELPKVPPGRFYGTRQKSRARDAARV